MHEQTRLQTYIRGALDAPLGRSLSGVAVSFLSSHAHVLFRRFATDRLLSLKLPDSVARLGRDLTAAPGQPLFPTLLERIDHPELGSLFARYVREPRAWLPRSLAPRPARVRDDTAAEDWASLDQRMRFILELFRSRQQNRRLLEPTFSVAQVHAMKQGRVPDGPLT